MRARPQVQGWHKWQMSSRALLPTALALGPAALGWVKLVKMLQLHRGRNPAPGLGHQVFSASLSSSHHARAPRCSATPRMRWDGDHVLGWDLLVSGAGLPQPRHRPILFLL